MAGRFSPIASQSARFGELGAMLLAVDVDLAGLDRGLNEARSRTQGAATDMGRNLDRFSRSSRFAMQNATFQIQDFIVQVAAGQGALRAFAMQAPQFASAFGPIGAVIGTVIALAAGLGAAFLEAGDSAEQSVSDLDALEKQLQALAERYADASAGARDFITAQSAAVTETTGGAIVAQQSEQVEALSDALTRIRQAGAAAEGLFIIKDDTVTRLDALVTGFSAGSVNAEDFRNELDRIAQVIEGPLGESTSVSRELAERIRQAGDEAVGAGDKFLALAERMRELTIASRGRILAGEGEFDVPEKTPPTEAERAAMQAAKERERQLESLRTKIVALQAETEAGLKLPIDRESAAQIKDLATAAATFGMSIEELKGADPEIRQVAQAYVEVAAGVRAVNEENERAKLAVKELNEALAREAQETKKENEEFAEWQRRMHRADARPGEERGRRIEAGSRLPDDISAANIAAGELSSTLTNIDSLTFEGLLSSLQSIGQRIAQMVLEALIFRAIMGSIGGGAGGGLPPIFSGAATGAARHGRIFAGGRLTMAQHGAVFSRGQQALMTGAVSGAALLEGAGDEAAVPLVRSMKTGNLSVETSGGGGGRQGDTYNLIAPRIDPGTASWLLNQANRRSPGTVVNAQKRSMMPRQASF